MDLVPEVFAMLIATPVSEEETRVIAAGTATKTTWKGSDPDDSD